MLILCVKILRIPSKDRHLNICPLTVVDKTNCFQYPSPNEACSTGQKNMAIFQLIKRSFCLLANLSKVLFYGPL